MLNMMELKKELVNRYGNEELYFNVVRCNKIRLIGRYEGLGIIPCNEYIEVWNDVGCITEYIGVYKPEKGGTRLYDLDGVYFM